MRLIPKTFTDPIEYGYATGRVKVLETKLLAKAQVERLVQADDLADQLNILAETDYGEFFEDVRTVEDVEEALDKYLTKVYSFLDEVCKKTEIIQFFHVKYDYHNLKVLLKSKYLGIDAEHIFSNAGLLDVEDARKCISEELLGNLPPLFVDHVKEALENFEQTKDSQEIDIALDRGLYQQWYEIAQSMENPFLVGFVKMAIDLANLRIFLRAKNLGRDIKFVTAALFDHGTIEKDFLILLYPQPLSELVGKLESTAYETTLSSLIKGKDQVDLKEFDKGSDNLLLAYAKKAKLVAMGPEPLLGYILAKENEVSLVRVTLAGKLNGLPILVVEERIRDLYV